LTLGVHEPAEWAKVIEQLLTAAGFCRGRALPRRDDLILGQWERLLENFISMGEVTGKIGFRRAITLISAAAREQPYGENGRDDGVHLVTPAEARGFDFDAVWVCGMTSVAWPGDFRPSALIPMGLQRDRGIPEAVPDLFRARSLEQLRSLLADSPQSIASWSAQEGEETLLPSPLIAHLTPLQPVQLGIGQVSGKGPSPSGSLPGTLIAVENDDPPPVTSDEKIRGGSRLLTLQSVCPARAFFELRMGAKEMPIPPFALDALTRGSLVHDAAEFLYTELGDEPTSAANDTVDTAIEAAILRALDRRVPPMHPLAEILRKTEKPRLENLLRNLLDFDRARGTIKILNVENKQKIDINGVELTVRFDRVDADDGVRLVIDYKTGGKYSANKWFGERPLEMQMPLYAAFGEFNGIVLYWMHASGLSVTGISDRDWGIGRSRSFQTLSPDDWHQRIATWRATCERLIAEFKDGDGRIDVCNDGPATGDYAMLTRRWMLRADTGQDSP
jgi:ATP-dependent helicase/nuclease subunit B